MSIIKVNYAAMENAQGRIREISTLLSENLGDLRSQLQRLHWTGEDRTAYQLQQEKWDTASEELNTLLGQIGAEVDNASRNYRESEMRRAASWNG
jgi:6 kDa early secretory antigenic target